jgi:hypothetical protein
MNVFEMVFLSYLALFGPLATWLILRRIERFEQTTERRFDSVPTRVEMNARFDGLERRVDRVEHEAGILRSDLTQIALAVGARPRPQTG